MTSIASTKPLSPGVADVALAAASPEARPGGAAKGRAAAGAAAGRGIAKGRSAPGLSGAPQPRTSQPSRTLVRHLASGYAKTGLRAALAKAPSATTAGAAQTFREAPGATAAKGGSSAAEGDPLAFLHDPKLSIEEKLMRLLAHLNSRWEKDIQKKMDEMAGHTGASGSAGASGTSAGSQKGGSFLGKIVDCAKKFFPEVGLALDALKNPTVRSIATKIGGPVLAAGATALGFPELAPALLKYAPAVIDVVAGAASALDPAGGGSADNAGGTGKSGGGASKEESSTGLSDRQLQQKLMEVQRIQDVQKEMFALVSNMLRSGHDLKMSVISNIR